MPWTDRKTEGTEPVLRWRFRRLRQAGLSVALAEHVAVNEAYDVDALLGLVDRGCPPDLAVRIVAPLDGRIPR